jgi:predicted acetyltransferase
MARGNDIPNRKMNTLGEAGFSLQHLEKKEEIEDYLKLVRRIWNQEPGVDTLAKKLIACHPKMTLRNIYVIKDRGEMVSTLNLIPVRWKIGGVSLEVAEMGLVGTLPEYRGRGLIQRLVGEFHKDVEKQGYELAVIEGIPYFYRQFGYEYSIPLLEETRIRLDQITKHETNVNIRRFAEKDVPSAMNLLERAQSKFHVHSVRSKTVWTIQHKTSIASDPEPFESYAAEEKGRLVAYFRIRKMQKETELLLTEISEVDQVTAEAILNFLKDYGVRENLETLSANISYEEPFSEFLVCLGGIRRVPTYAWQLRITDHVKIFRRLRHLMEKRLSDSPYYRLTEILHFNFRMFTIQVTVNRGKIMDVQKFQTGERSPIGLNPLAFVQLLTGFKSREELEAAYPDVRIAQSHRYLIDVLFPKLPSYIHSAY